MLFMVQLVAIFCSVVFIITTVFHTGITTNALDIKITNPMKSATEKFFILGSGSYTRKLILTNAGYSFNVVKADIDEYAIATKDIEPMIKLIVGNRADASKVSELVLLLANAKADAIIKGNNIPLSSRHEILLTADQVVVYNKRILEKPKNVQEARTFIEGYGVLPCSTVGSIVLTDLSTNLRVQGVDTCTIHFDPIDEEVIQQLLDEGEVLNCAGGLMVEHPLVLPFRKKIEGTEESVMGLSMELLHSLLDELNASKESNFSS